MMVATLGVMVALLAGCSSKPAPSPATPTPPAAPVVVPGPTAKAPPPSVARTPKEYRQDAARHLYQLNADRIYKGRLPPMLYAISAARARSQASRMRSGVAGATRSTGTLCPADALTASRTAKKVDSASISGGSPTALLR